MKSVQNNKYSKKDFKTLAKWTVTIKFFSQVKLRQYCHPFSDVSGSTYLLFVKGNIGWTAERRIEKNSLDSINFQKSNSMHANSVIIGKILSNF